MKILSSGLTKALAVSFPIVLAGALAWTAHTYRPYGERWQEYLRPVNVDSAGGLEQLLGRLDYGWPLKPQASVPRIAIDPLPADLDQLSDVEHRKSLFFRALLPIVLAENERLRKRREFLEQVFTAGIPPLDSPEREVIARLQHEYRVEGPIESVRVREMLLRRVDVVPAALVLAQAANESGWGSSRFARQGNNLFGQWTYQEDKGIVPAARPYGQFHAVRRFPSVRAAVRSHLHNLNVGHAYQELRELRAQLRSEGRPLDSLTLAEGLQRYSVRGPEYVAELRAIIRGNGLMVLRSAALRPTALRLVWSRSAQTLAGGSTGG